MDTKSPTLSSIFIGDIKGVQITQNRDNTGNIIFPSFFTNTRNYQNSSSNNSIALPAPQNCFYRVENATDVYTLILTHQELNKLKENNQ